MQSNRRNLVFAGVLAAVAVTGAAWGARSLLGSTVAPQPALASVPPLPPVTRSSVVVVPITIALTAIRDTLELAAPQQLSDKLELPQIPILSDADVVWSVSRGPFTLTPQADGLAIAASLDGTIRASGQGGRPGGGLLGRSGPLANLLGNLLGGPRRFGDRQRDTESAPESGGTIHGDATIIARPVLLPQWRVDPNLSSDVRVTDASVSILGRRLRVPEIVKRLLDRAVDQRVRVLQAQMRDDPTLEHAAREQWAMMCRSVPLGTVAPDMPDLWLEIRPTRAFAAQPDLNQDAVSLTIGVQAETRIVPNETKPDCPFPAELDIVPQREQGRIAIGVPIDMPFTELTRLVEAKLQGRTFPADNSGAFSATIKDVKVAASGDRLLVSIGVRANETKTWFGLGADATVHVWGRPVLDPEHQTLRLDDVALDIESQAAFGLLGAAARAAIPSFEKALADSAVIDLAPVMKNARSKIEASVADFRKASNFVAVDAQVTDLRLVDVQFDAKTLRVIAQADGTARAAVNALQPMESAQP